MERMTSFVETVKGAVAADALGQTLMHEHIFVRNFELEENWPAMRWDQPRWVSIAQERLRELESNGVSTVVDVTVIGLGRDIRLLKDVASGTNVNIVAATGIYTFNTLPSYFKSHGPGLRFDQKEPLHDLFVNDIVSGISGTSIKAGIIKISSDSEGITPDIRRLFLAAATAQQETGVTITTHSNAKMKGGLDQQKLLMDAGVDPARIIIGHSGDSTDIDYLKQMLDAGTFIGMDRFGLDSLCSEQDRVATVAQLCSLGYAGQMLLSHDAIMHSVNSDPEVNRAQFPNWHINYIPTQVIPLLKEAGVKEQQIEQMMIANPRKLLSRA